MTTRHIPAPAIQQDMPAQPNGARDPAEDFQPVRIFRCVDFATIVERVSGEALTWDRVDAEFTEMVAS